MSHRAKHSHDNSNLFPSAKGIFWGMVIIFIVFVPAWMG